MVVPVDVVGASADQTDAVEWELVGVEAVAIVVVDWDGTWADEVATVVDIHCHLVVVVLLMGTSLGEMVEELAAD